MSHLHVVSVDVPSDEGSYGSVRYHERRRQRSNGLVVGLLASLLAVGMIVTLVRNSAESEDAALSAKASEMRTTILDDLSKPPRGFGSYGKGSGYPIVRWRRCWVRPGECVSFCVVRALSISPSLPLPLFVWERAFHARHRSLFHTARVGVFSPHVLTP